MLLTIAGILLSGRCVWEGQRKSKVTCNMFISSFVHLLSLMRPVAFLTLALCSIRHPKLQCSTVHLGSIPTWIPIHLKPWRYEASPTMCSTSRAVYLLIASLTIVHNNQLRHCQRNTHSWHHGRREVRAGCSSSSSLLIHRRQESGDKQRVN